MMLRVLTPSEVREQEQELMKFCKENSSEMYNYMHNIKNVRYMAAWDERHRILNFVQKEKYLSKKKLIDFIKSPDTDVMKEYMRKFGSKMTVTTTLKNRVVK